nr:DUF47 family protein [Tissierella sp.]
MFDMFKNKNKEEFNYFSSFEEISILIMKTSDMLAENLAAYKLDSLEGKLKEIHEVERKADGKKEDMMKYLYKDFLPPIEREDIIQMAHSLDTVLDNIEDILIQMDIYQIESVEEDMLELMDLIDRAAKELLEAVRELANFKNPKKLLARTQQISKIEDQGDTIYQRAIKNLHLEKSGFYKSYRYSKIYDAFEVSLDSFEDLSNVIEAVILKNT